MKFLFLCSAVLYRAPSLRLASPSLRLASPSLRLASSSLRLASSSSGLFDSPEEIFTQKGRGSLRKKKTRLDKCVPIQAQYTPRGVHQRQYVEYLKDPSVSIVLGVGPAGCGKTLFACYHAIYDLKSHNVEKIVMTRPLVSVDKEELGFLPGTLVNKMDPWTRPIFDIFSEFFSQNEIEYMIKTGVIEISPLAYMRGRTFKHAFIIADEMQNSSPNQMLMMTTRIGEGSKMVITGDLKQSDRDNNSENGLRDFIQRIKRFEGENDEIRLVELDATDIERSPVVIKLLEMYDDVSPP